MTRIHIVFMKDHEKYKAGKDYNVERTLGVRLCEAKIAVAYSAWLDQQAAAKMAEQKAAEAKAKAEEAKKAELVKARSEDSTEKTVLRKAHKRDK